MPYESAAVKARGPKWEDPFESYKEAVSLADLVQQRRVRVLQEEAIRQKMAEEVRDRAEYERAQQAFATLPEGASLPQIVKAAGSKYGIPYFTQSRQAETAALAQKKTAAEMRDAEAKYKELRQKIVTQKLYAQLKDPDPARRQQAYLDALPELVELDMLTPEQAHANETYDESVAERFFEQIDPGKYAKLTGERAKEGEERKKAADEAEKREFEIAGYWAGKVEDQATYDEWLKIAPKRLAQSLPKEFTLEGWKKVQSALLTQQQRMQEERAGKTPGVHVPFSPEVFAQKKEIAALRTPVPGVDYPLPPGVAQQRIDITKAGQENKPLSGEAATKLSIARSMIPELQQLKTAIQQNGRGAVLGILSRTDTNLRRLAENAADKVGRLRSGGAVNKQEEERFFGQISRWADIATGDMGPATEAIDRLIDEAQGVVNSMQPGGPQAPPPAGGSGTVQVKAPNGKTYVFPNQAQADIFKKRAGIR